MKNMDRPKDRVSPIYPKQNVRGYMQQNRLISKLKLIVK